METDAPANPKALEQRTTLVLWLGLALAIVVVYSPSLAGGWVWDDFYQIAESGALDHPLALWLHDVWWLAGSSPSSDLYRPLAVASYVPGRLLGWGPGFERLLSLGLHLFCVAMVGAIARRAGAHPLAALAGAALFGLHPGASESVAWISGRHDEIGTALFLVGWWALVAERNVLAGLALGVAAFAKEPFLLAPLAAMLWLYSARRWQPTAILLSCAGVGVYLVIRMLIDLPLPTGAAAIHDPVAAAGGVAWRGLALTLVPGSADAVPPFAPLAPAGWLLLLLAPLLLIASRGRPSLGALLAPLPFLVPAIPASVAVGLNADRYFYVVFAGMGVASALLLSDWIAQRPRREGWRAAPRMQLSLALGLALILGATTLERSGDWTDNETLFRASLERNRDNAYAAFHLGHELHVRQGDCEAALPFYRAAMSIDRRAGNNRQACLLELGRMHEAAAMGPALVQQDPENPSPAANTARALLRLGDLESAESFVREALARDATRVRSWVLLGNVLGMQGRHGEAADAFERAIALGPDDHQARRGLRIAQQLAPL